ncbi:phosphohydrolase [uncultured Roseobacter sp.]|uniref:phosphohydrolase n=1 Tax=uncultured Roseobacter sp. TaxID=114847 RepID=UPI002624CD73|nr:phosphohydrolase [uncultured Roseobacter sp.]
MPIQELDLEMPDSAICVAAMDLARDASPPFLFNHVMRTFAFGHSVGAKGSAKYDAEMLFLGCMLHDLGLVQQFIKDDRFEIDGADAAADFLSRKGYPDRKIAVIWDAIALHTTLSVPQRKQPEIALVQFGAGIDVGAMPLDVLSSAIVDQILEAYPRMGFKEAMLSTMASVVEKKPMSGLINLMGDVGRECVHGFQVPSFCDVVRGANFSE